MQHVNQQQSYQRLQFSMIAWLCLSQLAWIYQKWTCILTNQQTHFYNLLLSFLSEGKNSLVFFLLFSLSTWFEMEISKPSKTKKKNIQRTYVLQHSGNREVCLFPFLLSQMLPLEFCISFHGNSCLVICPSRAGEKFFECILDISGKKVFCTQSSWK